ncbi:DNA polymerase III subunit delta' [Dellaglioa carnosa]|uniref:DNA polymerase III subunit delta n=1 Tax=Dellaglioa carnosa TaxID=2995136 RepID=A0ABT4JNG1_9LACO|nr:DNA polymerase III subunit delta' [Dellaglioa carnosa]MCZ2491749.1 DNA polymerase III subunit delta' [Dellaglioa carnosa]MCZ2494851.1 DNA polymerase III subunit delta' [Dellaglioa carnosa]MDK1731714.1 DNA polymerase III subunit delta' [Dellaglioa carnosa]
MTEIVTETSNMTIQELQPALVGHFKKLTTMNQLAHAYLFAGQEGVGKIELAQWVAMRLFCTADEDQKPCGICAECRRILSGNHPDVVVVKPDGQSIKVDQIRFLKSEFSKSGVEGNQKVFIIEKAESMTASAANSLLKFLEEPVGTVTAFLLTENKNQILPTIQSRCQLVNFATLSQDKLIQSLMNKGVLKDQANLLVHVTESISRAEELSQDENFIEMTKQVWNWFNKLLKNDAESFILVQTKLVPLVKEKGQQLLMADLITLLARDCLLVRYNRQEQISFSDRLTEIDKAIQLISDEKLVEILDNCLQIKNLLQMNIAFQSVLESTTLKLIDL